MKKNILFWVLIICSFFAFSLDLTIGVDDVLIIQSREGGYHLYIKAKKDIGSVLLTETTRDPSFKSDNYAYRATEWNPINGDEKRMLDGEFIPEDKNLYSLISSTVKENTPIGRAFHIWIPYIIEYGYAWSRNGEVQVLDGTYFNIRAFEKPYGDYSGGFKDNPYRLRVTQKPVVREVLPEVKEDLPVEEKIEEIVEEEVEEELIEKKEEPDTSIFMKSTIESFGELADLSKGKTLYAKNPKEIVPAILDALSPAGDKPLDLVFVIDATESMQDDITQVRQDIEESLEKVLPNYSSFRIALVLYKDYFEDFLTKLGCDFTTDIKKFRKALGAFRVQGGRDIPEAVYEGLDAGLSLNWLPGTDRKIILIGDAPPHPRPRGKITKEMVEKDALEKGVQVNVIILPHGDVY